ncbi:MAG TPA: RNA degradosome polyphosphate kinase, partial [Acidimicrobiales bacterium]|nr:RNA degradosome polyphosphate kinase [Acidimicrobiales bacterium]
MTDLDSRTEAEDEPGQETPDEQAEDDGSERDDPRYLNRDLAWIDFAARVLTLAEDAKQPLLERAKFLAIFSEGLDEFFQVRVAG